MDYMIVHCNFGTIKDPVRLNKAKVFFFLSKAIKRTFFLYINTRCRKEFKRGKIHLYTKAFPPSLALLFFFFLNKKCTSHTLLKRQIKQLNPPARFL